MKTTLLLPTFALLLMASSQKNNKPLTFVHHNIERPLSGEGAGTGGFTLNDYDGDGDLDVTLQRSSNENVYWYEFQNDSTWIRHDIGKLGGGQLGAVSVDVDGDKYPDLVMGRAWFRNPGVLKQNPDSLWQLFYYNGGLTAENHDIESADINLDGQPDIVCYSQPANILRWYNITDPYQWKYHDISFEVNNDYIHAGFSPNGIGDLNGDKFPDIIMPFYWYENPGSLSDTIWKKHSWPYPEIKETPYGRSLRSWMLDLDKDRDNDIIFTDCDVANSRAFWLENQDNGKSWMIHPLPIPLGPTGSFHSLQVFDVNLDGLMDIFIGEQEDRDNGMKPVGLQERGMLLLNEGTRKKPAFSLNIIHRDNPGWHDTQTGDVDGDGDIDLVTKIWNADEIGIFHADYWENKWID